MYRFAGRPLWLLSHVLVAGLILALFNLGLWQLRRLDDRRDRNDLIEARTAAPEADVADLVGSDPADVRFRPVEATGAFVADQTVRIDNRSLDGRPGSWILTPLVIDPGGEVVLVNRGFATLGEGASVTVAPPPAAAGLTGTVAADAGRSCGGAPADDPGIAFRYGCVDIDRIADDLDVELVPFVVRLTDTTEASLSPVPPPELGEGPHLSYAVQWFIFTAIAVGGYPLVLRRVARQPARGRPGPVDDLDAEPARPRGTGPVRS